MSEIGTPLVAMPGHHQANAFGFLRLLFASLVIVSHAPELADGDRSREPLTQLFHSLSLGEVAVAGFFVISGYLITASYKNSRSIASYLIKRVARIYPAFVVATLISVFLVVPFAGGRLPPSLHYAVTSFMRAVFLQQPDAAGAFAGMPYQYLDGPMWTISYEFRCYLIVVILGVTGILSRAWPVPVIAAALLVIAATLPQGVSDAISARLYRPGLWFGSPIEFCRLTGLFLSGAAFHLFRNRLPYSRQGMIIASIGASVGLTMMPTLAYTALAVFGPYLVIGVASTANTLWMRRLNSRVDISYGVYLYAWPVTKLLLLYFPAMPVAAVALYTFVAAVLCGWLSWHLIEKPVMERVRSRPAQSAAMRRAPH